MGSGKRVRWSWIVGALIIAAAMIGGAFITRGAREGHAPTIALEAHTMGVTASIAVSL
jgi:hypothetical protein